MERVVTNRRVSILLCEEPTIRKRVFVIMVSEATTSSVHQTLIHQPARTSGLPLPWLQTSREETP